MPNWCENHVYIETTPAEIEAIIAAIKAPYGGLLHYLCPEPEHPEEENNVIMPAWYNWRRENWGTKWEVQAEIVSHSVEGGWINLAFDSAWSPPIEAFDNWLVQDNQRKVNIRYIEWGMAFCGEYDSIGVSETYSIPMNTKEAEATIPAELDDEFGILDTIAQWEQEEVGA